ncbi:class I SAM-dependent methyltransferase [Halobaculum sp. CBA1158]|uniref:class I SAM-dependent methyltransferase n=1 Tax=Halobaculum sp. CBA1158 TaxID=2904243 RepID=UPI001F22D1D5|nr:class I SAM-dependent methyltransferase [Halobaculum sp. CBA1158]UIO98837.1 class I SAM-dependent methyltransferase [Halobaculum sp. CBA1158]
MDPEEVRADWADREGEFSPRYYAAKGPDETSESIRAAVEFYAGDDARVLEVGCGSGRHLERLRRDGLDRLAGVDINDESFDVMGEFFPDLADVGTFHTGAIEAVLPEFDDDAFDVVYSVETLQHVHPDDTWVFEEVVRVCSDLLITVENEGNGARRGRDGNEVSYVNGEFPLYHRDWKAVFSELGTVQVTREPSDRDTFRAFRIV